jgi:hypothetical protein
MNFSEILTFVRQRIKKLPESPFLHTYIYIQRVIRFWQITVYTFKCVPRRYVKPGFYVVHSSTDIIIFPKSVSVEQELPGKLFPSQTGRPFPVRNVTQVTFYTEVEFLRYLYTTELDRFVEFSATSSVRGGKHSRRF